MSGERTRWEALPESAWRLRIGLSVGVLSPPAIQYAVSREDPVVQFVGDLGRVASAYQAQLSEIADPERRELRRVMQYKAVWNCLFRSVTGDEVYLLTPASETVLMSNTPAGRKWLFTKAVQVGGRTLSWSVPFEAAAGKEVKVELTEGNALDLAALGDARER